MCRLPCCGGLQAQGVGAKAMMLEVKVIVMVLEIKEARKH
jgi:hypothetical protein